jgi:AcrR family transcriptional regulator
MMVAVPAKPPAASRRSPAKRPSASVADLAATRERLITVAGEMFAETGFEQTSVRDVCARANANVAAVNYHFGSKFGLYEAAIGYWLERENLERQAAIAQVATMADPEEALRAFIAAFIARLLDRERPRWHARLVAREMANPTAALDAMVARTVRPTLGQLRSIIARIVGHDCPKATVERAMLSIIAQCVFYMHCRPIIERVFPDHANQPDLAALTQHLGDFSVAGVRAICRTPPARRKAK